MRTRFETLTIGIPNASRLNWMDKSRRRSPLESGDPSKVQGRALCLLMESRIASGEHGPPIVEYLRRIDETLRPFGGRFIIHGGEVGVLEELGPAPPL